MAITARVRWRCQFWGRRLGSPNPTGARKWGSLVPTRPAALFYAEWYGRHRTERTKLSGLRWEKLPITEVAPIPPGGLCFLIAFIRAVTCATLPSRSSRAFASRHRELRPALSRSPYTCRRCRCDTPSLATLFGAWSGLLAFWRGPFSEDSGFHVAISQLKSPTRAMNKPRSGT